MEKSPSGGRIWPSDRLFSSEFPQNRPAYYESDLHQLFFLLLQIIAFTNGCDKPNRIDGCACYFRRHFLRSLLFVPSVERKYQFSQGTQTIWKQKVLTCETPEGTGTYHFRQGWKRDASADCRSLLLPELCIVYDRRFRNHTLCLDGPSGSALFDTLLFWWKML